MEAGSYALGLVVDNVTNGYFQVIGDNIVPILSLMGIMLGVAFARKMFNKSRKGKI